MVTPKALILTGYGINCDEETGFAFENAKARSDLVHINDLIASPQKLKDYQIVAFPGGFSFGDDTGSGNALAWKIRNNLGIERFLEGDKLMIGICNGFQVLVKLGLLPALEDYGKPQVALAHNDSARYSCRWVDLKFSGQSPWVRGLDTLSLPIAHGEGNFYADRPVLEELNKRGLVVARYIEGEICQYQDLPANPNGSLEDIAGITDKSMKILGMMPHPERAIFFTQSPNWPYLKEKYRRQGKILPDIGEGIRIFENGVRYFQ